MQFELIEPGWTKDWSFEGIFVSNGSHNVSPTLCFSPSLPLSSLLSRFLMRTS